MPISSTWPDPKWPPMRSPSFIARSRLTGDPAANAPTVVTNNVSGETSTEKSAVLYAATVKQAPFTLMLTPVVKSLITVEAMMVRRAGQSLVTTVTPISSTIPVNIQTSRFICAASVAL
jgi:hypothetical protein